MRKQPFFIVTLVSSFAIGAIFLADLDVAAQRPERPEGATSKDTKPTSRGDRKQNRGNGDREQGNRDGGRSHKKKRDAHKGHYA